MKMDWCSFGPPEMQDIYQLPENRQLSLKKIKKEELKPSLLPDMNINVIYFLYFFQTKFFFSK